MSAPAEPADITLDDLPRGAVALLTELARIEDAGETLPSWKALGETLSRDPSNLRKSVEWLEARGLVCRDPLTVSAKARALINPVASAALVTTASDEATFRLSTGPLTIGKGFHPVPLGAIQRCDLNPRKTFDTESLDQLAASIAEKGLLQPVLLRPHPDEAGAYQIAAGERRWRAMRRNVEQGVEGWTPDTPVNAVIRPLSDIELLEVAIAENRDREDVHPLEEAEAYKAVVDLRVKSGETFEAACASVGAAAKYTGRHVEKRIRLAEKLSDKARSAMMAGRLSLAAAQEIAPWPEAVQNSVLANVVAGYHGWKTAVEIRAQLRRSGLPVGEALFDRAAYDGAIVADDDGEVYADRAQAQRLQEEALERIAERRSEEGWAAVVTDPAAWDNQKSWPSEYGAPKTAKARSGLALLLHINAHSLKLEERYARPATRAAKAIANAPAAQPPQGRPPARSEHGSPMRSEDPTSGREEDGNDSTGDRGPASGAQAPASPAINAGDYEKRHWRAARTDKTVRLQTALASAPVRFAHAVTLCALYSSTDYYGDAGQACHWMSGHRTEGDDAQVPPAGLALLCRAASEFHDRDPKTTGVDAAPARFRIADPVKALPHLLASPALERMFAAAIAAQAGTWPGYNPAPGDAAFVIALTEQLGDLVQPFKMSEAYLSAFAIPQLQRIADACVHEVADEPAPSAAMPKKKAKAVEFVLNHVRRDTGWTPPEMAFCSPAAAETGARKLMNGEG